MLDHRGCLLGVVGVDNGSLCNGQHGAEMCQNMVESIIERRQVVAKGPEMGYGKQ